MRGLEGVDVEELRFVPTNTATTTKRMIQDLTTNAPHSHPLLPNRRKAGNSGGEEIILVEMLTQGGARRDGGPVASASAPRWPWAKILSPLQGTQGKQRHPAAALLEKCPISSPGSTTPATTITEDLCNLVLAYLRGASRQGGAGAPSHADRARGDSGPMRAIHHLKEGVVEKTSAMFGAAGGPKPSCGSSR